MAIDLTNKMKAAVAGGVCGGPGDPYFGIGRAEAQMKAATRTDAVLWAEAQLRRPTVLENVCSRLVGAERSAQEAARYRRLAELLEKHPDVAEILNLVRDLGVL